MKKENQKIKKNQKEQKPEKKEKQNKVHQPSTTYLYAKAEVKS